MKKTNNYVGFGIRFIAASIDSIIFFIAFWILGRILVFLPLSIIQILIVNISLNIIVEAFYEIFLTYRYGGTIGKLLMKCRVTNAQDKNISLGDSFVRYFSKWLSVLAVGIGYFMIIWDSKKQGLHDKIASTYVINNPKSRIKDKIKKTLIAITLLIVIGYVLYYVFFVAIGIAIAVKTEFGDIDTSNPVKSVLDTCNSKVPFYKDACISQFSGMKEIQKLNLSERMYLCSNINSREFHNECVTEIAVLQKNQSICSHAKSNYYKNICKKTYNFTFAVVDKFYPEEELVFNGSLEVGKHWFGLLIGDTCVEIREYEFLQDDRMCFSVRNVSGFEKGEDGLNWYDIASKEYDEDGNLKIDNKHIYGKDGHINLKDNILDSAGMNYRLNETPPGIYLEQMAVYDRISNKGTYLNITIEVLEKPKGELKINNEKFGLDIGPYCVPKKYDIYTPRDTICLFPLNVSGFEKNPNGYNAYDYDIIYRNESGDIFSHSKNIYEEDGYEPLRNNILNHISEQAGLKLSLSDFPIGVYSAEAIVKDRISKKSASMFRNFSVVEFKSDDSFYVLSVKVGYYDGFDCIRRNSNEFSSAESICLSPSVTGFEKDADGLIWFDMDNSIIDSTGQIVDELSDVFGEDWEGVDPPMYDYFAWFKLQELESGDYTYEVVVHDKISKKSVTVTKPFTIVDDLKVTQDGMEEGTSFVKEYPNAIKDILKEKETKTYTINGMNYEVTADLLLINEAYISVNGVTYDLDEGETATLPDGSVIKLDSVFGEGLGEFVEFYLGYK